LDDSPAYFAAVALNPEMRFDYFEQEWMERPDWIEKAKNDVIRLWESDYKDDGNQIPTGVAPGTRDFDFSVSFIHPLKL
jgi:hypothetical protein